MSFFGSLVKAAIEVACLPVSVAKDALTLGGAAVDQDETYTRKRLRRIGQAANDERMSSEGEDILP